MIERFLYAVQRALAGVVGIVVLFALLAGLVLWAKAHPEALEALAGKLVDAVVWLVSWLADLIVSALSKAGE
jgi:uncharacterized iron-regulated membrane protein